MGLEREQGTELTGEEEEGATLRRGMGNSGTGQSFLINFDPTEGGAAHSLSD